MSFGVNYRLNPRLYKLLFKYVEVLEIILLVDKIVFQRCNRTLHVEYTRLLALKTHGTNCHEVAHHSFCCDDSEFFISLLVSLQKDRHHLLATLDEFEILLLCKLKRGNLIMEHTDVPQRSVLGVVAHDTCLVTKRDSSEELNNHQLVHVVRARQNDIRLFVEELSREHELIWEVL